MKKYLLFPAFLSLSVVSAEPYSTVEASFKKQRVAFVDVNDKKHTLVLVDHANDRIQKAPLEDSAYAVYLAADGTLALIGDDGGVKFLDAELKPLSEVQLEEADFVISYAALAEPDHIALLVRGNQGLRVVKFHIAENGIAEKAVAKVGASGTLVLRDSRLWLLNEKGAELVEFAK